MSLLDKSINKKANYWMEVFANCVMAFLKFTYFLEQFGQF